MQSRGLSDGQGEQGGRRAQMKGGRHGREWASEAGTSVLISRAWLYTRLRPLLRPFVPMSLPSPSRTTLCKAPLLAGCKDSKSLLSISLYLHLKIKVRGYLSTSLPISTRRKEGGKCKTQNSGRIIHPLWASLSSLMRI